MGTDADARELLGPYWEMTSASQEALLQCARLLMVEEPDCLRPHLVEHMAIQTRLLADWRGASDHGP